MVWKFYLKKNGYHAPQTSPYPYYRLTLLITKFIERMPEREQLLLIQKFMFGNYGKPLYAPCRKFFGRVEKMLLAAEPNTYSYRIFHKLFDIVEKIVGV